jgi:dimethylaniline monooxygenase (N-oxide forming)
VEREETFDGVLVCTGHHADKNVPTFPGKTIFYTQNQNRKWDNIDRFCNLVFSPLTLGLDKFKGEIIHSHDYKTLTGYEDKRIVIIGIGNSGGDAAVELSRVAKQVLPSHSPVTYWNKSSNQGR